MDDADRALASWTRVEAVLVRQLVLGHVDRAGQARLGAAVWSVPRRFMSALTEHKQVAVPSCFGSSKMFSCGQLVLWASLVHPVGTNTVVTLAPLWR
ncbi:hypothetical protein [Nonomuraea dietziae]|uniref:hypothetical protein n=1 Tax=Nonomuraea dietziae TaxID=65515 RepID=UPI0031DD35C2